MANAAVLFYVMYYSIGHYKADFKSILLHENINAMYVPSFAVRHNDATINLL